MSDTLRQEVAADLGFMMDKELREQTVKGLGYSLACKSCMNSIVLIVPFFTQAKINLQPRL